MKIRSIGGYFGEESSQETPNTQTSLFEYADGTVLEFGTRGGFTNDEGSVQDRQPVLRHQRVAVDRGDGQKWQSYFGPKNEKGPGADAPDRSEPTGLTTTEYAALPELHRRDSRRTIRSC